MPEMEGEQRARKKNGSHLIALLRQHATLNVTFPATVFDRCREKASKRSRVRPPFNGEAAKVGFNDRRGGIVNVP